MNKALVTFQRFYHLTDIYCMRTFQEFMESMLHEKQWIQDATKSIKKRGTEGVCTGEKFGSESCPAGSKRYNLAKTFKKMAKKKK